MVHQGHEDMLADLPLGPFVELEVRAFADLGDEDVFRVVKLHLVVEVHQVLLGGVVLALHQVAAAVVVRHPQVGQVNGLDAFLRGLASALPGELLAGGLFHLLPSACARCRGRPRLVSPTELIPHLIGRGPPRVEEAVILIEPC